MNNRDELSRIIGECAGAVSVCWSDIDKAGVFDSSQASKHVDDAVRGIEELSKPCTVSTVAELDALPNGSVIRDKFNDVSERRDGYWCGYETAPLSDQIVKKYLPASVLYEPEGK